MVSSGLVKIGAAVAALAVAGWLVTGVVLSFASRPTATEDLTTAWTQAGATPLGGAATVTVEPGSTLVAFLVGTQLLGTAGTTTGSCTATDADGPLTLGWPVHVNRSLNGVLTGDQETVAIAGWTNRNSAPATVRIRCDSGDSTVDHFVAVPTRTAVVASGRWFQPWGWVGLGLLGFILIGIGFARILKTR